MKTELWCSRGGRRVVRSASKGAVQFRFSTFAMLAAFLPLIVFAHSAYAQTTTPAPVRPRPPTHAPLQATTAAQTPATTPAAPFSTSPSVVAPPATAATPPPAPADSPPAPAATSQVAQSPATSEVAPVAEPSPANAAAPGASAPTPAAAPPPGETSISTAELPQDLSPWGMFLHADIIVKLVMIGLAVASLATWTVWLAKWLELRGARSAVRRDLRILQNCPTLSQAHERLRSGTASTAFLVQAAGNEIRLSASLNGDGLKERIAWQLERIEQAASRKMARGTGVLATIGSTAPFVGLFGISKAHTTNLAVVAPGIAEALLATALGLVAAIPAVIIYNVLARSTAQYRALLGDASAQVMKLVSRDLDRAQLPLSQAAE
jgi:biopolymer transport protein ExbB